MAWVKIFKALTDCINPHKENLYQEDSMDKVEFANYIANSKNLLNFLEICEAIVANFFKKF